MWRVKDFTYLVPHFILAPILQSQAFEGSCFAAHCLWLHDSALHLHPFIFFCGVGQLFIADPHCPASHFILAPILQSQAFEGSFFAAHCVCLHDSALQLHPFMFFSAGALLFIAAPHFPAPHFISDALSEEAPINIITATKRADSVNFFSLFLKI